MRNTVDRFKRCKAGRGERERERDRERESACGRPQITLFPQWTIKGSNLSIEGELTLYRKLAYFGSRKIKEAHQWKFEEMGQIRRKLWVLESCDHWWYIENLLLATRSLVTFSETLTNMFLLFFCIVLSQFFSEVLIPL